MWKSSSNSHSVRVYSFETSLMWKSLWSANSHKCCGVARWNFENYQKDVNSMWCVCFWISQFIFTFYGLSSTHRTYSIAFNLHKLTFLFDVRCYHRLLCPLLSGICRWCTKIVTLFCRKFTTGTTTRMEHKVYYWPKNSSSPERWAYGKKSSSFHRANWEKPKKVKIYLWFSSEFDKSATDVSCAHVWKTAYAWNKSSQPLGCHVLTSMLFPSVDRRVERENTRHSTT